MAQQDQEKESTNLAGGMVGAERIQWAYQQGSLSKPAYRRWMVLSGQRPAGSDWYEFIQQSLLFVGAALVLSGVIFFFAYNWAVMGRFVKLGVVQLGLLVAVFLAWNRGLDALSGQICLLVSAVLIGPLLAVYGQIYQTGADPYELFLGWALLALGWTVVSRLSALWIIWILLLNLALALYCIQILQWTEPELKIQLALFALNIAALGAWEFFASRNISWLQTSGRWAQRTLFSIALFFVSSAAWISLMTLYRHSNARNSLYGIIILVFVVFVVISYGYYRHVQVDTYPLAALVLSIIVLDTSYLARLIKHEVVAWFFLSFLVVVQAAVAVFWLRRIPVSAEAT